MKKFNWFALFLGISMMACEPTDSSSEDDASDQQATEKPTAEMEAEVDEENNPENGANIDLQVFPEYPEGVDGCSCYFSFDEEGLVKSEFMYVDNFGDTGFVMLNG
ncbi:MAG: hypothetical protein AAFU64_11065, partial [Bacteroidota bacterium]